MPSINKNLLPIKAHFFLSSGLETCRKMLPLIYREKGISSEVVGIVFSMMTVLGLLFTAVGGALADYFKIHRMMLILLLLVASIGTSAIYFLPELPQPAPVVAEAGREKRSMQKILEVEGHGIIESSEMNPNAVLIETTSFGLAELLLMPAFVLLVICHATDQVTTGLVFSLADTLTFKTLNGENTKYGEQRMFNPIGLMINAAVCGYLVDWYSIGLPQKDLLPAFALCLALGVLDISALTKLNLPPEPKQMDKVEEDSKGSNISEFLNFKVVIYLVNVFVVGFAMNLMWVFKPLVAEDITNLYDPNFGYHKLLQGLMISMQNLGGTIFYFVSGFLIRKFGHTKVILFGHVCLGLHFVIYYFVSNPWYILPLELLQGPSYCVLMATNASYAAKVAPPNALGSLQAIKQFVFFFGYVAAGFAGGYVYNSFGGYLTFFLTGCFVFSFAVFYALCKSILKLQDRLAWKEANVAKDLHQSEGLVPTPPPSPETLNKSIKLAKLDSSFMRDFVEISYTPYPKVDKPLTRKDSLTSCDSGCHDMVIESVDSGVDFRTLTSRKSVTPNVSVNIQGPSPKCSQSKSSNPSFIESVKKAVSLSLSPSFRAKGSKSDGSKRVLPFWDSTKTPSQKSD